MGTIDHPGDWPAADTDAFGAASAIFGIRHRHVHDIADIDGELKFGRFAGIQTGPLPGDESIAFATARKILDATRYLVGYDQVRR